MGTEGRTALYRFYDHHEALLYVGISNNPRRRWAEHAQTKPWYPQVQHQAVTWYGTEREARAAELRAISQECPEFNVAGAVRPPRPRFAIYPRRYISVAAALNVVFQVMLAALIFVPLPSWRAALVPCVFVMSIGVPVVTVAAMVLISAPAIRRCSAWVERNSAYPDRMPLHGQR